MPDAEVENQGLGTELNLVLRSRSKTFFEGKVVSVTSNNAKGIFDVLPTHANFITLVKDFVTVRFKGEKEQKFKIQGGVMRVTENRVDIYLTT